MAIAWEQLSTTVEEHRLISNILKRATRAFPGIDHLSLAMDLEACHSQCPLDLPGLLAAKDGDFAHDVGGIVRHIDREDGTLRDCFVPRCSKR